MSDSVDRVLRVAVVGVGRGGLGWGGRGHIPGVRRTAGTELRALCTDHEASARAAAEQFGVDRYYANVEDLAAADDIDLVTVATRPRFHHQVVRPLLRAGKMVYCEWPLGIHLTDAAEMTAQAEASGALTGVGTQGRHSPAAKRVRELLDAGDIGRPLLFHAVEFVPRPRLRADQWWVHSRTDDAAVLGVLTAHLTDLIQHLLGPIDSVSGHALTALPHDSYVDTGEQFEWSANDTVGYQAVLKSGAVGVAHLTGAVCAGEGFQIDIVGEEGQYRLASPWYSGFGPATVVRIRRGSTDLEPLDFANRQQAASPSDLGPTSVSHALTDFRRAWLAQQRYEPAFSDATQLHRVVESIQHAWLERRWVSVSD
jgi:predicted dehydrogenase